MKTQTKLYKDLYKLLVDSGLSERAFCRKYEIPHAWFIEFMNPTKTSRRLRPQTMSLLYKTFDIDLNTCIDYNCDVLGVVTE